MRINCDATADDLIDVIEGNRIYMPCVYALNKIDAITMEELDVLDAVLLSVSRSSMQPAQVDVDATTLPLESCVELL